MRGSLVYMTVTLGIADGQMRLPGLDKIVSQMRLVSTILKIAKLKNKKYFLLSFYFKSSGIIWLLHFSDSAVSVWMGVCE